jgi:hypothetical protein
MVETETTLEEQLQTQSEKQRPHHKKCGLCFYHCVCNCSYGVVSVSTIGFVTVLTVWSLFLPLGL